MLPVSPAELDLSCHFKAKEFRCLSRSFRSLCLHSAYTADGAGMVHLTKATVDAARADPNKAQIFIWDDKLSGFGVRVARGGVKSYIAEYRVKGTTQSRR